MTSDIVKYMQNDTIRERFSELMGERNAAAYISSVLLAVANSKDLSVCTPASIYTSALRAATLRLSVDPGIRQAYLVPFRNKAQGTTNATLIIGYKGLYDMAVRTGKYRYINVGKLYEGQEAIENQITGLIALGGARTSDKVIGYIGAFEMVSGYAKTIYKTIQEIDEHAQRYSKGYNRTDSFWKTQRVDMEKKTVLRELLSKWGHFDPSDARIMDEVEEDLADVEIIEGEQVEIPDEAPRTVEENMNALGYDEPFFSDNEADQPDPEPMPFSQACMVQTSDGKAYGDLDNDTLSNMTIGIAKGLKKTDMPQEKIDEYLFKRDAIQVILAHRATATQEQG